MSVWGMSLPSVTAATNAMLVHGAVHGTPEGPSYGGGDGDDAPVCAKVLHAPDEADDDGREGENATVANPVQSGHEREECWLALHGGCGEEELSQ